MNSLSFRLANQDDIPAIHSLAVKIWKAHYPGIISDDQIDYLLNRSYTTPALQQQLTDGHVFWLLYADNIPSGYLSYSKTADSEYFLHKLYVDLSLHRTGAGTAFFKHVFDTIEGIQRLRLTVNRQNYKAINYYFKSGFIIEEVKDFDVGSGYVLNDFVMIKKF